MEGKTVMLTYMQRGVGLVALLSMNLVGRDTDAPYFQADNQPKTYIVAGVVHHNGLAWTREGDTLTIKPLEGQTLLPFKKLAIGYPNGKVVLECNARSEEIHTKVGCLQLDPEHASNQGNAQQTGDTEHCLTVSKCLHIEAAKFVGTSLQSFGEGRLAAHGIRLPLVGEDCLAAHGIRLLPSGRVVILDEVSKSTNE